jgi:hypothetical protein
VESPVDLKLLAEVKMDSSLVKLELLLGEDEVSAWGEDVWTLGELGFEAC